MPTPSWNCSPFKVEKDRNKTFLGFKPLFYLYDNSNSNSNSSSIFGNCFGMFCFVMYHILCYIHKGHSDIARKRHKVFGRIQPFGLLLSALILAVLSLFAHIVEFHWPVISSRATHCRSPLSVKSYNITGLTKTNNAQYMNIFANLFT